MQDMIGTASARKINTMRVGALRAFLLVLPALILFSHAASADTEIALKAAKRALREQSIKAMVRSGNTPVLGFQRRGPNFSGRWAGRYVLSSDNCRRANIQSFLFRHVLAQNGGSASLATSHDGSFSGTSRDRGRRLEFTKRATSNCDVAVVYKNLANNQQVSGTGYAVACTNGCVAAYGANAIKN
jgi:hypothetical protein